MDHGPSFSSRERSGRRDPNRAVRTRRPPVRRASHARNRLYLRRDDTVRARVTPVLAMDWLRPEIAALEQYGITRVVLPRIDDPDVIALWFGEGDLATEAFILDAAKQALDDGETFYPRAAASEASSVSAADRRAGALRNRSGLQGSFRASVSDSGGSRSSAVSRCMVQSQPVDSRQFPGPWRAPTHSSSEESACGATGRGLHRGRTGRQARRMRHV